MTYINSVFDKVMYTGQIWFHDLCWVLKKKQHNVGFSYSQIACKY